MRLNLMTILHTILTGENGEHLRDRRETVQDMIYQFITFCFSFLSFLGCDHDPLDKVCDKHGIYLFISVTSIACNSTLYLYKDEQERCRFDLRYRFDLHV